MLTNDIVSFEQLGPDHQSGASDWATEAKEFAVYYM